jgi:adenosylhomocysteine nucleosidase
MTYCQSAQTELDRFMIVVVGLAFEARIAARSAHKVVCASANRDLAAKLHDAIDGDCRGLVSFGIAGGLRADLAPGTCVVASEVVEDRIRYPSDRAWSLDLLQALPGSLYGIVAGRPEPVATAAAKAALHAATGAVAADMESHVVARVAAQRGLPMVALRIICDPADRTLPDGAVRAVRADGTADIATVLRSLVRSPEQIPLYIRLARDAHAARMMLKRCRRALVRRSHVAAAAVPAPYAARLG